MRRLFPSLTALGLLGLVLGCHHMHGVCDCDPGDDPCCPYGHPVAHVAAPTPVPPLAAPVTAPAPPAGKSMERLGPPTEKPKDKEL